MVSATTRPATEHDIIVFGIWIKALGEALIKKGVLTKAEITDGIKQVRPTLPPELQIEVDNMIELVAKW